MAGGFAITIRTEDVEELASALGSIDGEALGAAALRAVNTVTERTYDSARARMIQGIALTDAYLQDRMAMRLATDAGHPVAVITARRRHTTLGTYNARQEMKPVKNPKRSKGDPLRGIPPGLKAAGVSVEVTRGARKTISYAFLVPQNVGKTRGAGRLNVFSREGNTLFMRYGPSVYQLFNRALQDTHTDIEADLRAEVIAQTEGAMRKALT